jgi:hypothetical protein
MSLTSLDWQVHVYGDATREIQTVCDSRKLSLHVFPWRHEMSQAGLRRNAVYLVRPDGYVALADPAGKATTITSYLDARELTSSDDPIPIRLGQRDARNDCTSINSGLAV